MVLETKSVEILESVQQQKAVENQENPVDTAKLSMKSLISDYAK